MTGSLSRRMLISPVNMNAAGVVAVLMDCSAHQYIPDLCIISSSVFFFFFSSPTGKDYKIGKKMNKYRLFVIPDRKYCSLCE